MDQFSNIVSNILKIDVNKVNWKYKHNEYYYCKININDLVKKIYYWKYNNLLYVKKLLSYNINKYLIEIKYFNIYNNIETRRIINVFKNNKKNYYNECKNKLYYSKYYTKINNNEKYNYDYIKHRLFKKCINLNKNIYIDNQIYYYMYKNYYIYIYNYNDFDSCSYYGINIKLFLLFI